MDSRAPERLVGVDVPHAGDGALVEDRRLDRGTPPGELLSEVLRAVRIRERLAPDARIDVCVHLVGLQQEPGAEPPDVSVGNVRPVV